MTAFIQEQAGEDGWSRWVQPVMRGYKLACCDCGLVHVTEFRALKVVGEDGHEFISKELPTDRFRVEFRVRRDNRSTGQMRRHMKRRKKENMARPAQDRSAVVARELHDAVFAHSQSLPEWESLHPDRRQWFMHRAERLLERLGDPDAD